MRKILKKIFFMMTGIMCSCAVTGCGTQTEDNQDIVSQAFIKASGKYLRNDSGKGDIVFLRGTNAGGYLLQEFWMTPTMASANVHAQEDVLRVLAERFGQEKADELVELYETSYFTEADFDNCKALGMNCLRLPFWYRNIVDEEGKIKDEWYSRFDWFIEEAAKREMYVILDFHGAPGSQNGSDHSGKDGLDDKEKASEFFFGENAEKNQELFYNIWEEIAERYRKNPYVAGYDLLNEPYCTYRYSSSYSASELHNLLWNIYDTAYKKIRAVDSEHLIIMEATWDPVDLPSPSKYGWENIMYEYHNYLYDDYDNKNGQQIANMKKKIDAIKKADYDVPSYMGEFAFFNNIQAWEEGLQLLNDSELSWTTWTYKVVVPNGNWGIYNQNLNSINIETADFDDIYAVWKLAGKSYKNAALARTVSGALQDGQVSR